MADKNKIILGTNKDTYIAADDAGNIVLQHEAGQRVSLTNEAILPSENGTLDLGSAEKKFKDLYLSNNTIYMGDNNTPISLSENGTLTVDGEEVGGGGGLEGTQYVFVTANGTDVENAAELQAAYTTAASQAVITTELQDIESFSAYPILYADGTWEIALFDASVSDYFPTTGFYDVIIDGVTYNMEVTQINSYNETIFVTLPNTITTIGSFAVYVPKILSSTVIAANGYYNFSSDFVMDTERVNLVSLDGNKSIIFNGTGTLSVEADHVFVKGVDVQDKAFRVSNDLPYITIENCSGGDYSFSGESADGTLIPALILSGNFIKCVGGGASFGGNSFYATLSGTFTDCTGGYGSFSADLGTLSGTFNNCTGGEYSFYSGPGTLSGTFNNCTGAGSSFGGYNGAVSGTFTNCIGDDYSFGNSGNASGTFNYCTGGYASFGGDIGALSGKLYYCRLTSGTFNTVTSSGRTVYCVDGNNNTNNQ